MSDKLKKAAAAAKLKSSLQKKKEDEFGEKTPMVLNERDLEKARVRNQRYGEEAVLASDPSYLSYADIVHQNRASRETGEIFNSEIGPWKSELLPENLGNKYGAKWSDLSKDPHSDKGAHAHPGFAEFMTHPFQGPNLTSHEIGHLFQGIFNPENREQNAWKKAKEIAQEIGIVQDDVMRRKALRSYGIVEE